MTVLFLLIFSAFAQWIDMPDCPYGTQYVGDFCQNMYGHTTCPIGYRFDAVQSKCVDAQASNSRCPVGTIEKADEYGQVTCEQKSDTQENRNSDSTQETQQKSNIFRAVPEFSKKVSYNLRISRCSQKRKI